MWLKRGSRFSCGHASATVSKFVQRVCHSHRVCRGHLSLLLPPSHPSEAAALFVDLTFLPRDAARAPSIRLSTQIPHPPPHGASAKTRPTSLGNVAPSRPTDATRGPIFCSSIAIPATAGAGGWSV